MSRKNTFKNVCLFSMLLSGAISFTVFFISLAAEIYLKDPLLLRSNTNPDMPSQALIKMLCFIIFIIFFFIYVPLKFKIHEQTIPKKSGIVMVTVLTYLLTSVSLAFFLSFSTGLIDYNALSGEEYPEAARLTEKKIPCHFNFRESFFDSVSGFTTTGLTAFRTKGIYKENNEKIEIKISKIDAQPNLIHIIRGTYLWIGGLGIMFFYLYFTPVPSLMMSLGYEISAERSLPRFIRLEGFSFSLVYTVITILGILLLFICISNSASDACSGEEIDKTKLTHAVTLSFSSISTGGFSTKSNPINEIKIKNSCYLINNWGLLVIMFLMLAGAMPIFSLHRPMKFFKKWILVVVFLLPIVGYSVFSYSQNPQTSFYRSFDALSAFTTTGLYTSQFEKDFNMPPDSVYMFRYDKKQVTRIYKYRVRNIYIFVLMFIGGASYSTAGGWGFFNFFFVLYVLYLIINGKLEKSLTKYIIKLILSFLLFFLIFAIGTICCYESELFGTFSESEPSQITDYIMNSAFYEISALSTVGLMPNMIQKGDIYYSNIAYLTLAISMLIGRLYYIIFPFIVSPATLKEGN